MQRMKTHQAMIGMGVCVVIVLAFLAFIGNALLAQLNNPTLKEGLELLRSLGLFQ